MMAAVGLLEFTATPQALVMTPPPSTCKLSEALGFIAYTHLDEVVSKATARAVSVGAVFEYIAESDACCGCWIMTSIAKLSAEELPELGGLFTVTVKLLGASTKPLLPATLLACAVKTELVPGGTFFAMAALYAAESAAPCMFRLVPYQVPTSVPSAVKPSSTVMAIATIGTTEPERSSISRAHAPDQR